MGQSLRESVYSSFCESWWAHRALAQYLRVFTTLALLVVESALSMLGVVVSIVGRARG